MHAKVFKELITRLELTERADRQRGAKEIRVKVLALCDRPLSNGYTRDGAMPSPASRGPFARRQGVVHAASCRGGAAWTGRTASGCCAA